MITRWFQVVAKHFEWQSSILDGCRALWALPSVFKWSPNIRLIARRFRVIAGRFENNHQAVSSNRQAFWATVKHFERFQAFSSDRRGYAKVSLSCPHYLFKKRAKGSLQTIFHFVFEPPLPVRAQNPRPKRASTVFSKFFAGSCRRFFILYLSHLCLCTLKIRVRNARRRFF